jgi:hypothetical protein
MIFGKEDSSSSSDFDAEEKPGDKEEDNINFALLP